jgi:hypothetical protein
MLEDEADTGSEGKGAGPADADLELTLDDRFRFLTGEFRDSIEALRETHAELAPAASQLDSLDQIWDSTFISSKRLTRDDLQLLRPAFLDIPEEGLNGHDMVQRVWDAVKDADWGPSFAFDFSRRLFRPKREPIFHNAILISLVAAFEASLSRLATEYYRAAPEALHRLPKEAVKEFSLRELQSMGSIDDAIEIAIERRVNSLMFGSLADWKKFFSERMNIEMGDLISDWGAIQEVFERRHCLVHSEGKASRRYIRNYPQTRHLQPLDVDAAYVEGAMGLLELLGSLLHMTVWSKFALDGQQVIDEMERIGFSALKDERWEFSLTVYEAWQTLPLSGVERQMSLVNIWIARKNIDGIPSIANEVAKWDVSGSAEIFTLARLCLLEELDEAFALLPIMMEHGHVGGQALATWPLLAPLREDKRIQSYADVMRDFITYETDHASDKGDGDLAGRDDFPSSGALEAEAEAEADVDVDVDESRDEVAAARNASTWPKPTKSLDRIDDLEVGERISHRDFGNGSVVGITGALGKRVADIDFDDEGRKKLLLKVSPITKLSPQGGNE